MIYSQRTFLQVLTYSALALTTVLQDPTAHTCHTLWQLLEQLNLADSLAKQLYTCREASTHQSSLTLNQKGTELSLRCNQVNSQDQCSITDSESLYHLK